MQIQKWLAVGLITSVGIASALSLPTRAVQFPDGRVAFNSPPRLLGASTTQLTVADSSAKYYFDLSVPENAGEPLQQVVIEQREGDSFIREVEFETERTRAFVGNHRNRDEELTLGEVLWNEEEQTLTVNFDPAVPPGTDLTIRVEPERNPRQSGVYLFGVTAFPEGQIPQDQFLGYGRLQFYDNGDSVFDVSNSRPFVDFSR